MPPKGKEFEKLNPTVIPKFGKLDKAKRDSNNKIVVNTEYRPMPNTGFEILTPMVLNSGNLNVLKDFQKAHEQELGDQKFEKSKKYLDARIKTTEKVNKLEEKAKKMAATGKRPKKPTLDYADGFIGLSNVKYPAYQSSFNGCWSIAYSALLNSRGVNLSQEEIRQWRPDYKPGEPGPDSKRTLLMNSDTANSIHSNADLAAKVLPNTAVNMLHIEPAETAQCMVDGMPLTKERLESVPKEQREQVKKQMERQIQIIKDEYKDQAKKQLQNTIHEAITVHRSPVPVTVDGHYVTITGISEDGETLRYEDSIESKKFPSRTRTMKLDDLVHRGLEPHLRNGVMAPGKGIELCYLSDVPEAVHGKQEPTALDGNGKNYVQAKPDGTVDFSVPLADKQSSISGSPTEGQVDTKSIDQAMELKDSDALSQKLGGKLSGWGATGGMIMGSKATYYPKKVVQLGDPALGGNMNEIHQNDLKGAVNLMNKVIEHTNDQEAKKKLENHVSALEKLGDELDDPEKREQVRKELQGACDVLTEKDPQTQKPVFSAAYEMDNAARHRDLESFARLNRTLGLGRDEQMGQMQYLSTQYTVDYERERARQTEAVSDAVQSRRFLGRVRRDFNEAVVKNQSGALLDKNKVDEYQINLAKVASAYALHQQMKQQGIEKPYPTEEQVNERVPQILESEAFQRTVTGWKEWNTIPKDLNDQKLDNMISGFVRNLGENQIAVAKEKEERKSYTLDEDRLQDLQRKSKSITHRLNATKTGHYYGTNISRISNSSAFDKVKETILNTSTAKQITPEQNKKNIETVMSYLNGKEKVRKREFGRERWDLSMTYLATAMPRDKFEEYCAHVNRVRGVGPDSPHYVGPETFYGSKTTTGTVLADTRKRVLSGDATERDYARLIALQKFRHQDASFHKVSALDSPKQKQKLVQETEAVLSDPQFKTFLKNMDAEVRNTLINGGNGDAVAFSEAWEAHKQANPAPQQKQQDETIAQPMP